MSLFHASTCFEHHVLIVRRSKLYYTASGIITPIGDRPVHRLLQHVSVFLDHPHGATLFLAKITFLKYTH